MSVAVATVAECEHCGLECPDGARFCCRGCEVARHLILDSGLERFYELRGSQTGGPPRRSENEAATVEAWLEETETTIEETDGLTTLTVGVGGLYCAACVWLIETLARRSEGLATIAVNPARGTAELSVGSGFSLRALRDGLADLGYTLRPPRLRDGDTDDASGLVLRTGIAVALALNAMMFAAAIYLGLESGALHTAFVILGGVFATGSAIVGGGYFGRRAVLALRARVISLDVPIALGIALVYIASLWGVLSGRPEANFFDSLSVFVALMLGGRLLAQRIVAKNRARIASSETAIDIGARRIVEGRTENARASDLLAGDIVLVAAGETIPSDIELLEERAGIRSDWISGESDPELRFCGDEVEAGSTNAGRSAIRGRILRPIGETRLPDLLSTPAAADASGTLATSKLTAAIYLGFVAASALGALAVHLLIGTSVPAAIEITAAVLVVTCPCALGIGAPLAIELVAGRLAREGAHVRTPTALSSLARVRHVAFDKTGTLTERRLRLDNREEATALRLEHRQALYNLAARSSHPKSAVLAEQIDGVLDNAMVTTETVGVGIEGRLGGHRYRLGAEAWASDSPGNSRALAFSVDGAVVYRPRLAEVLRTGASAELDALRRDGIRVSLVTGDSPERAATIAEALGIPENDVVAGARPENKARWVRKNDKDDLLFVGDGLNDSPALAAAMVSATPAFESPIVTAKVDLVTTSNGLRPLGVALRGARVLRDTHRRQLAFVLAYNTVAVGLAAVGLVKPWLAALIMPASSVAITVLTTAWVRRGLRVRRGIS